MTDQPTIQQPITEMSAHVGMSGYRGLRGRRTGLGWGRRERHPIGPRLPGDRVELVQGDADD
jgi:hypothetical protein